MSAGGSSGSSDSRFERTGTVKTSSYRDLTPGQRDRFHDLINTLRPWKGNASDYVDPYLRRRMQTTETSLPYRDALTSVIYANTPNKPSPGQDNLTQMAAVNPYSPEYAQNTFDRYAYDVRNALGTVRSNPGVAMGGTAAQGFMMSDVVDRLGMNREQVLTANRGMDSQIAQNAAGALSQGRGMMNNTLLSGVQGAMRDNSVLWDNQLKSASVTNDRLNLYGQVVPTFTSLTAPMYGEEINNLVGRGAQTSSSIGGGINLCCFIFMEAYNGKMPWWVRYCRDQFAPESTNRRKGYIRMSRWLVPLMRVSGLARRVTDCLLIQPLTRWGAHYVGCREKVGLVDKALKNFWFKVWEVTGK